jgi:hypothetical protein
MLVKNERAYVFHCFISKQLNTVIMAAVYNIKDSDVSSVLDFDLLGCDTGVSEVVTSIQGNHLDRNE